jgi:hypothetical protein
MSPPCGGIISGVTKSDCLRIIEPVISPKPFSNGFVLATARIVFCAGAFLGGEPLVSASDYRVAWMRTASGPGDAMTGREPGWAWFHHSSKKAEGGPSPRLKYREFYHTAGVLSVDAEVSARGDWIRTPADGVLLLRSPEWDLGLAPSTEIRTLEKGVELISGEIWFESRNQARASIEVLAKNISIKVPGGIVLLHLRDSEMTHAQPSVFLLEGSLSFAPRSDGSGSGSFANLAPGESLRIKYPDASQGVDNRRFFSAMEPEPESIREKIDETAREALARLRAAPRPPAPAPVLEANGSSP